MSYDYGEKQHVAVPITLNNPILTTTYRWDLTTYLLIRAHNHRTGGQIGNNDSADDVRDVDLTKIHYLTGPFDIEGALPGDLLLVEIMDVQPFEDQPVSAYSSSYSLHDKSNVAFKI